MKILHIIPSYEPAWAFGGTVSAKSELCRALAKKGVDITVYTTDADGKGGHLHVPVNKPVDLDGVKVWYFHCDFGIKRAFYSRQYAEKSKETIKEFDLVHLSAIWQWIQVDVYRACKSSFKPYVISTHGSFSPWAMDLKKMKKTLFWYIFGRKTIEKAAAIHFTTEEERISAFSSTPLLKKIPNFIVPNGIEIKKIKEFKDIRKSLKIPDDKFILLFIGRIHKVKGIHFVLEALKKLNDKKFLFLIIGQQEDADYVKRLHKLSDELSDSVILHKPVPRDKVWDFYSSSNLFILPSFSENFSNVAVEAMACGLPVLISRNVGIWREVQSDATGFVVDQNVNEIASILKKLSEDSTILKDMSQNAKKAVEKRFEINNVASQMVKAYEDVLTGRKTDELRWM